MVLLIDSFILYCISLLHLSPLPFPPLSSFTNTRIPGFSSIGYWRCSLDPSLTRLGDLGNHSSRANRSKFLARHLWFGGLGGPRKDEAG